MTYRQDMHQEDPFAADQGDALAEVFQEMVRRFCGLPDVSEEGGAVTCRLSDVLAIVREVRAATTEATHLAGCVQGALIWHCAPDCPRRFVATPTETPPAPSCPDCGHIHTAEGCTGPPTASDRWAGVSPAVCDCDAASPETPPALPRRHYDPDHCTACGDFLPCGNSWIDGPPAASDTGEGETTVEWQVIHGNGRSGYFGAIEAVARSTAARAWRAGDNTGIQRRERTRYPDRVTAWQEVPADE